MQNSRAYLQKRVKGGGRGEENKVTDCTGYVCMYYPKMSILFYNRCGFVSVCKVENFEI